MKRESRASHRPESEPAGAAEPARDIPPYAALRAFEAVFRTGGIRKAATRLNLDHAVVSRHVHALERWLGAPLVLRTGNRLQLTDDGALYHRAVTAAFADLAIATRTFRDKLAAAPLRLTSVPGLSIQWLSSRIAEFERRYPQYAVELKPTEAVANLLAHEADLDIRYYRDSGPLPGARGLRVAELARPRIIAVASRELLAGSPPLGDPRDFLRMPLLHEEDREEWTAWLRIAGAEFTGPLAGPLCWHAHLAISAAKQGRGVALANRLLVEEDLRRGDLVELGAAAGPITLGSYAMLVREDRWSMPALKALRRFLRAAAQDQAGAGEAPGACVSHL